MELTRRNFLANAAALLVEQWASSRAIADRSPDNPGRKVLLVTCGGIRREDSFAETGVGNIPHLYQDLVPQGVFYPAVHNLGVTSHFNTISSMLTGQWQRLDDWGKTAPISPTLFELARRQRSWGPEETWLVSSNKALTSKIGASSVREYGPAFGANVLFPKQLLISAVVRAASEGRAAHNSDRGSVRPEIEAMLRGDNFDGLGWSVSEGNSSLGPKTLNAVEEAIGRLVNTNVPVTGDEFTYLVSVEVMRRFAPSLLVITFSDVEVAHFGSYSLHLGGIRTMDRLVYELWNEVQSLPAYKNKTTLFVLPEFGRDTDGSSTNGFFNHRQNNDSTRQTWMVCLGQAVKKPGVLVDRPTSQLSLLSAMTDLLEVRGVGPAKDPLEGVLL